MTPALPDEDRQPVEQGSDKGGGRHGNDPGDNNFLRYVLADGRSPARHPLAGHKLNIKMQLFRF
jgi:hypothetical protein